MNTIELYAMQTLSDTGVGFLEWHLVICQSCRGRLEVEIEFVTAMREAATKIRRVNVDRSGHEIE
jgi:hypothetical protein